MGRTPTIPCCDAMARRRAERATRSRSVSAITSTRTLPTWQVRADTLSFMRTYWNPFSDARGEPCRAAGAAYSLRPVLQAARASEPEAPKPVGASGSFCSRAPAIKEIGAVGKEVSNQVSIFRSHGHHGTTCDAHGRSRMGSIRVAVQSIGSRARGSRPTGVPPEL